MTSDAFPYVTEGGYVYLMEMSSQQGKMHKIGVSRDPERRRRELERWWGCDVKILAAKWVSKPFSVEGKLHSTISGARLPRGCGGDGHTEMLLLPESEVADLRAAML